MSRYNVGMILGKFSPAHYGHIYMVETARTLCKKVYLLVYSMDREPIPGKLRYEALKKHFENDPIVVVKWINKDLPQYPEEHPDFWNFWKKQVLEDCGEHIDCMFGSEQYVKTLSQYINSDAYCVDIDRRVVPISGTDCRKMPLEEWSYIIPEIRNYFTKKICIVGGESTGKSSLTRILSKVYQTNYVEEYGREYCEILAPSNFTTGDFSHIARVQIEREKNMLGSSNKILFCDTDAIVTQCFHMLYLGERSTDLDTIIKRSKYDHYFLLAPNIAFVQDGTREFENKRQEQFNLLKQELITANREYTIIEVSDPHKRVQEIKNIIDNLWLT